MGGLGNDDEVKPSLATRRAIELLGPWMTGARRNNDRTAPSVLRPQRFPWNPGGYTFGWFNSIPGGNTSYLKKMPSEFYLWTHAYDVSGVQTIEVKVRIDGDGSNTTGNDQNETYAGGSDVGSWVTVPMTKRTLPKDRAALNTAANNGQIDYFITSPELADYYFAKITNASVPGFRGKLLDYFIEATDTRGNVSRSEIQHVFVEDDGASATPPGVPANVTAQAVSATQITVTWAAVAEATLYVVRRNGTEVGTTAATTITDGGLAPSSTHSYTIVARNAAGDSTESAPVQATTDSAQNTPLNYIMDGAADSEGYRMSYPGMTIYAAVRGTRLYVATWSPGNSGGANDHFVFVSDLLLGSAAEAAPWGKVGAIAVPVTRPYLAGESLNAYAGWTNAPIGSEISKAVVSSGQMEGSIDLAVAFGRVPDMIYLAAAAYQTANGGVLAAQAPEGNGDGNIDPAEFLAVPVASIRDTASNGVFDFLDPQRAFHLRAAPWTAGALRLVWPAVPGHQYRLKYSPDLAPDSWSVLDTLTAPSGVSELSVDDPAASGEPRGFYRIESP